MTMFSFFRQYMNLFPIVNFCLKEFNVMDISSHDIYLGNLMLIGSLVSGILSSIIDIFFSDYDTMSDPEKTDLKFIKPEKPYFSANNPNSSSESNPGASGGSSSIPEGQNNIPGAGTSTGNVNPQDEEGTNPANLPPLADSDEDEGFGSDSDRSFHEDNLEGLATSHPTNLQDDVLHEYIRSTRRIITYPALVGMESDDPSIQGWVDRHNDLNYELKRRIDLGHTGSNLMESANRLTEMGTNRSLSPENQPEVNPASDNPSQDISSSEKNPREDNIPSDNIPAKPLASETEGESSSKKRKYESDSEVEVDSDPKKIKYDSDSEPKVDNNSKKRKYESDSDVEGGNDYKKRKYESGSEFEETKDISAPKEGESSFKKRKYESDSESENRTSKR